MKEYIYTERNGIYIIDLQQTVGLVDEAYNAIKETVMNGGNVLFVGTKKQAQEAIKSEAERCGMFYVSNRWLGGMLTNFKTMRSRVARLKQLEQMEQDGSFEKYTKKWEDIVPFEIKNPVENRISQNYCSGVFISAEQVEQLLKDYETDEKIRLALDNFYSDGHISVFLKALQSAQKHKAGLLEATEVVEPNLWDLDETTSYSNLYNCDPEGAYLYQKVALQQLEEIENKKRT